MFTLKKTRQFRTARFVPIFVNPGMGSLILRIPICLNILREGVQISCEGGGGGGLTLATIVFTFLRDD